MKRNYKTEKQKAFLKKMREHDANWEAQRKLGYKPLDKPIHDGYNGEWVLRVDISRRDDAWELETIIRDFGKKCWSKDTKFKAWDWQIKRYVDVYPSFRKIDEREYENLNPWAKKYFSHYISDDVSRWGSVYKYYRVNIPDYYLVRKVSKSYKTHYKVIDEVLKQEEAEIEADLWTTFYDERCKHWGSNGSSKSWRRLYSKADRAHNKKALRKNMSMMVAKYDDISDDWACWLSDYCDEFAEFRYTPKRTWW